MQPGIEERTLFPMVCVPGSSLTGKVPKIASQADVPSSVSWYSPRPAFAPKKRSQLRCTAVSGGVSGIKMIPGYSSFKRCTTKHCRVTETMLKYYFFSHIRRDEKFLFFSVWEVAREREREREYHLILASQLHRHLRKKNRIWKEVYASYSSQPGWEWME